ncbi:hypothetical protein P7D31_12895 [Enterococcus dongliensis]|uniref:hypothetical protein n=1 Tax=Enterococcus dongliensis TaxID=2559925 RepID=UPI0028918078|nr:hypothetical protein [Enterococcus dongliensis]MDT2640999.1 hypothetical protein [Enterococcus dongliensis]
MASYSLNLSNLMATSAEPRPKNIYENGERTEKISDYSYNLIDVNQGAILSVTIPKQKFLPPQSFVEVINPVGTPYVSENRALLSIKADDIIPIDD